MFKTLLPCLKRYKKETILAPTMIIGEVIMEILIPLVMAKLIDIGIPSGNMRYVLRLGGLMIAMALASLAFGTLSGKYAAKSAAGFATELRKRMFAKIQTFSFSNIDRFSTASLITRLTTDVTNTQTAFMMIIRTFFRSPFMLIFALIASISINAKLSLIFVAAVPILAFATFLLLKAAMPRFQAMLKKYDEVNASVQENLIGIRTVKAFVREKYETQKFHDASSLLKAFQIKAERIMIYAMPAMQFIMYACMIAVCFFGGKFIIGGEMQTGDFMSFISYIMQILMALMMIAMIFVMIAISRASIVRIVEVLQETPDLADNGDASLRMEEGSVAFRHVSFAYDGKTPVLKDISFSIPPGQMIGIIGATGSAKTSLVQLIPRLYDATEGEVLVGGRNVRAYSLAHLRDAVAMVLQKNVLFSGTILENLRWGNENATKEEVIAACKTAQAHDFISAFPDGYETDLGQGGVNLSGGQKQRLTIARALLKKPKILILDDSTSAVDTMTDAKIQQAFRSQIPGTTKIIIAQRIASVEQADQIIVLDDGKISAMGDHATLLATSEIYREIYESQKKGVAQ